MLPTDQCFVAVHLQRVETDLRLEMEHELALDQCTAECLFEGEGLDIGQVQRGVEEAVLGTPGLLGRVHGGVGAANQRVDVLAITGADAYADAGAGVDLLASQGVGGGQFFHQRAHPSVDLFLAALPSQQHDKFVTTEARSFVTGLQQALDAPGHGLQQQVADLVPERVVDRLETVHVDEQDRHQAPFAELMGQGLGGDLDELTAVVQAAEVIGGGGVATASVGLLQAADQLLVDPLGVLQFAEGFMALA